MPRPPVNTVTLSKTEGRVTPKIFLKFTKPNGHTIEMRTVKEHPPTDDMLELACQLADYLTTGKRSQKAKTVAAALEPLRNEIQTITHARDKALEQAERYLASNKILEKDLEMARAKIKELAEALANRRA